MIAPKLPGSGTQYTDKKREKQMLLSFLFYV